MDGSERKKFYITRKKLEELKKEYERLQEVSKKRVGEEVPKAFESEDLNPEFVSFQEDSQLIKSRLEELETILSNYELVKKPPKNKRNIVDLGARVIVEVNGKRDEIEIVGTLEANPVLGKISNESPVGKSLLGHKVGDIIEVPLPTKVRYKIKSIKYDIS